MISKLSVKKPYTVVVAMVLVVILGAISFTSMNTDLLPEIDLPYVVVMTTYPGASPEKVETAVTKPLEQVLATAGGVEKINSTSNENSSMIMLKFSQGINMDSVMIDLSAKIEMVKNKLDDEVSTPMLMKLNPNMIPIVVASVDIDGLDSKEVSKIVKKEIIPSFERIGGVASVESMGLLEDSIKITLDSKKIEELNNKVLKSVDSKLATSKRELDKARINLLNGQAELEKATKEFEKARDEAYKKANLSGVITKDGISKILMAQNFSMPAGYIKERDSQYLVKVGEKFASMEELKDLVLFHIDVSNIGDIHIEDIGKIEFNDNSEDTYVKVNKNNGIILTFQKQSTFSTSEVSKSINENMQKLMKENKNIHIKSLQDQGVYIGIVIDSVLNNLVLGGILAIVILFIFLRSIKPTIVIAFSIPISLLFALAMMYFSGVTMNIISLSGLALGVGMLVDNSIVVIENIHRLRSEGMNALSAAVKGTTEVAGAITSSTLTTISVFLPIVFTKGLSRQLFTDMGLTIAYSLIASLIIAVTVVPTMSSIMLKNMKEKEHKIFDRFVSVYEKALEFSLKHRLLFLSLSAIFLIGSTVICIAKGTILMPNMDSNQISVSMKMPKRSDRKTTRELSENIVNRISSIEDVETIGVMESNGQQGFMFGGGSGKGMSYYIILKDDKKLSSKEVGKLISDKTKDLDCKIKVQTSNMDMSALGDTGIKVNIKGSDLDKLKEISKEVSGIVGKIDGIHEITNGLDESSAETRIIVNKSKAMEKGLTVAQVYQDVSSAIKIETKSTTLNVASDEYPVILVNDEEGHISRDELKNYKITVNKDGKEEKITLSDIAKIEETESLSSIKRDGQVRTMSVKGLVKEDHNVGLVSSELEKKLKDFKTPEGYTVNLGGEKESMDTAFSDLIKMIALAIVFIYLIMVAQFQSLLSPFIVLFTIPLAFTGGFIALIITGFELSMISMLGFLILSGIVVNNGIVFVDYVNQLRLQGMDKKQALILTGKTRIRPILMTALTTILGLSTLSLGIGMGADMVQPMAIVTIGGLTYATILTLFIVPIIYDVLNRRELRNIVIDEEN